LDGQKKEQVRFHTSLELPSILQNERSDSASKGDFHMDIGYRLRSLREQKKSSATHSCRRVQLAYCRNPDQGSVFFFLENAEGIVHRNTFTRNGGWRSCG